jgi:hypothetical protein
VRLGTDLAHVVNDLNAPRYAFVNWCIFLHIVSPAGDGAENYRLLCPQGGCKATTEYDTCRWATVPSHAVVVNPLRVGRNTQVILILLVFLIGCLALRKCTRRGLINTQRSYGCLMYIYIVAKCQMKDEYKMNKN